MLYMGLMRIANSQSSHVCWATLGHLLIFDLIYTIAIISSIYLLLVAYRCVLLPTAVLCYALHLLQNTILAALVLCTLAWFI